MKQYRVLFVCLGNICRSPAGDNVMRNLLQRKEVNGVYIDSAGTAGYHIGKKPDARMTMELESRGITVTGAARQFVKADFDEFDLIIPMDNANEKDILSLARNSADRSKVKPFMTFCNQFTNPEVPDPYYGEEEGFALVADLMEDGCSGILDHILQEI